MKIFILLFMNKAYFCSMEKNTEVTDLDGIQIYVCDCSMEL